MIVRAFYIMYYTNASRFIVKTQYHIDALQIEQRVSSCINDIVSFISNRSFTQLLTMRTSLSSFKCYIPMNLIAYLF